MERKWEESLKLEEGDKKMKELEQRMESLEMDRRREVKVEKDNSGLGERVRKVEERWERRDRMERRRNVVIKGYKIRGGNVKEKVLEILKQVGAEVGVEEVREVRTGREAQGGFAVRFRTEGEKREEEERGAEIWIEEDLT